MCRKPKAITKHEHFGLKKKWIDMFFDNYSNWKSLPLGNRQLISLISWLKTAEVLNKRSELTILGSNLIRVKNRTILIWEIIWVNIVFNFETANWFVHLSTGCWKSSELKDLLKEQFPHLSERTISNAIVELVGTLEYTPIGDKLRQGKVLRKGRAREVIREGYKPSAIGLNYSLMKLFNQQDTYSLDLNDERLLWPWIIFGCKRNDLLPEIVLSSKYYDLDSHIISLTKLAREEMPKWLNGSILISSI